MQEAAQRNRQGEIAALHTKMPEWADQAVAQIAMKETQDFLSASEFTPEEINGISDHRYLLVAWKAAQFDKLQQQAPKKLDKLRSLPKPQRVLKSGVRRDASSDAAKKAQKKFDRLRETGDERDAATVLEGLL
jgi:hypothetical protein